MLYIVSTSGCIRMAQAISLRKSLIKLCTILVIRVSQGLLPAHRPTKLRYYRNLGFASAFPIELYKLCVQE
jgi:hypothetical protein